MSLMMSFTTLIVEQPIRESIALAISLRVEHFSTLEIHRAMLFSIAKVIKSRKKMAQITIAAAMIALTIGVYTGHNSYIEFICCLVR